MRSTAAALPGARLGRGADGVKRPKMEKRTAVSRSEWQRVRRRFGAEGLRTSWTARRLLRDPSRRGRNDLRRLATRSSVRRRPTSNRASSESSGSYGDITGGT